MQLIRPFLATLAAAAIACAAHANLVTNGSFETGDFTGWILSGNTGFTGVTGNFSGVNPEDGNFQGFFGAVGSEGFLDQNIVTTPGQAYTLSFWLYNFGGTPSEFAVSVDSNTLVDQVDPGAFPYTNLVYTFAAVNPVTDLDFAFQQDPSYFLLDNISVVQGGSVPDSTTSVALLALGLGALFLVRRRQANAAA